MAARRCLLQHTSWARAVGGSSTSSPPCLTSAAIVTSLMQGVMHILYCYAPAPATAGAASSWGVMGSSSSSNSSSRHQQHMPAQVEPCQHHCSTCWSPLVAPAEWTCSLSLIINLPSGAHMCCLQAWVRQPPWMPWPPPPWTCTGWGAAAW